MKKRDRAKQARLKAMRRALARKVEKLTAGQVRCPHGFLIWRKPGTTHSRCCLAATRGDPRPPSDPPPSGETPTAITPATAERSAADLAAVHPSGRSLRQRRADEVSPAPVRLRTHGTQLGKRGKPAEVDPAILSIQHLKPQHLSRKDQSRRDRLLDLYRCGKIDGRTLVRELSEMGRNTDYLVHAGAAEKEHRKKRAKAELKRRNKQRRDRNGNWIHFAGSGQTRKPGSRRDGRGHN